jgi:hypothetical protein
MPPSLKKAIWIAATCIFTEAISDKSISEPVTLEVSRDGGNKSSPLLYGIMFEVIPNTPPSQNSS